MSNPSPDKPAYLDPNRSVSERVQDLLSRLTLEEKISQMTSEAAAIPRLGIPAYNFWSEALHGVARNGRATVFPQPIGLAATWDPDLIQRLGSAIGDEGRAKYHAALEKKGHTDIYQGLTFWSPNVNLFRDPRWGRGMETWGEDPILTGEMGAAFVRGLQGDHPKYLKAAACAKHYAVHSGPEKLRHEFNAQVSPRELNDTYLPAFKKLVVEARVEAVMCAYNRVNGDPACASPFLLEETLRQKWGFEGHVVSDCWALSNIHRDHQVTPGPVESAALALRSGCDLSCICTYDRLGEAIEKGLVTESELDRSLARTLSTRFKLGMFDPPEQVPYSSIPLSVVSSEAHRQLAYEAAVKSIVLLKNKDNLLPIGENVRSIHVVGPTATDLMVLLGNYYGLNERMVTLLEGIVGRAPEGMRIEYRPGVQLVARRTNPVDISAREAAASNLTIACMGISSFLEGEEGESLLTPEKGDRLDLNLPEVQQEYVRELAAAGAKVILVLTGGSPITLGDLADLVDAIVWVGYPGQEGGRAVADVLFGDHSPSGKLPVTFPRSADQLPPFEDYRMENRTYRYARWEPLYPFGFGLSYARFTYEDLRLDKTVVQAGLGLFLQFRLTNHGPVQADEVVQVYLSDQEASVPVPLQRLVAFRRVTLQPGESTELEFSLPPESLMLIGEDGEPHLEPGNLRLLVGGSSPGVRSQQLGASAPLSAVIKVETI